MLRDVGFSIFRIMVGIAFLVGGYDKVVRLVASGFQDRWLVSGLSTSFMRRDQLAHRFFYAQASAYRFRIHHSVLELVVGVCVVFGIYRMFWCGYGYGIDRNLPDRRRSDPRCRLSADDHRDHSDVHIRFRFLFSLSRTKERSSRSVGT